MTHSPRSSSPPGLPPTSSRPPSTVGSDDSILPELSFDYSEDENGVLVRTTKDATSRTSLEPARTNHEHSPPNPPSPVTLNSPASGRRGSLSRSESAYSVLTGPTAGQDRAGAQQSRPRALQRIASGPISSVPMQPHTRVARTARRTPVEDSAEEDRTHVNDPPAQLSEHEEKENHGSGGSSSGYNQHHALTAPTTTPALPRYAPTASRLSATAAIRSSASMGSSSNGPLADVVAPQRSQVPMRPLRVVKTRKNVAHGIDKISEGTTDHEDGAATDNGGEVTDSGVDEPPPTTTTSRHRSHAGLATSPSGINRPRRSASVSDAARQDEPSLISPIALAARRVNSSRPGSSQGLARRVTLEEHERQNQQELDRGVLDNTDVERHPADQHLRPRSRQSPSPPSPPSYRTSVQAHKRRDSDTVRSAVPGKTVSPPKTVALKTPGEPFPSRGSPPSRQSSASARHRRSPTALDQVSSPPGYATATKGCTSGNASSPELDRQSVKSPVLCEQVPQSTHKSSLSLSQQQHQQQLLQLQQQQLHLQLQPQQQRQAPPVPMQVQQQVAAAPTHRSLPAKKGDFAVNKKQYTRLDVIGKGGSSRVFRVMSPANQMYAIKRVYLDKADPDTIKGYMNEIALLKRLGGNNRIIQFIDSELKPGAGQGTLYVLMELGEIDFAKLLYQQRPEPLNMVWVAYYWQQILQAVDVIHEERVVHSDLKPANFVLVKGQLKLIDFGIANAIANDTTNISRDTQVGTVNYMSPEAIELGEGMRRLKLGRPSDVWSLGCILYQMIYGHPPFHHLSIMQKMKAIPDNNATIPYAEYATPLRPGTVNAQGKELTAPEPLLHLKRRVRTDVIATIETCLTRNQKERATIPELMAHAWLAMPEPEPPKPDPDIRSLLKADEAIITPHFMSQLLSHGIAEGLRLGRMLDDEELALQGANLVAELQRTQAEGVPE